MRKDRILEVIEQHCGRDTIADMRAEEAGISIYEIADKLDLLRNNVNADVNRLFQEGKVIKICHGKKYRFYSQAHFQKLTGLSLGKEACCQQLSELIEGLPNIRDEEDPFTALVGYGGSLKSAILSAKASVLYPGGALHCILLGESGVGKSLFAEKIYSFGKKEQVFQKDGQFVVFNCADYANNAELLLSQLFGSIKGAYTGAEQTREGLLKRADGGVLFLDEVHRLPPEGQEMLFYFIDKKKYRMLGETSAEHEAKVTLVLATTESPKNHLLTTFMRRIPMVINIPSLKERSLAEKKQIVLYLFAQEAGEIRCPILIDKDVLTALLLYDPSGNIGQMKNDIKLAIARSYLEVHTQKVEQLHVHKYSLSYPVWEGMSDLLIEQRKEIEKVLLQDSYVVAPYMPPCEEDDFPVFCPPMLDASKEGIQASFQEYVEEIASTLDRNQIPSFIIDKEISEIMSFVHEWCLREMNVLIERSQSAALSFYLKNVKENNQTSFHGEKENKPLPEEMMDHARVLIRDIERHFHLRLPAKEIYTLATILNSFTSSTLEKTKISMFAVAHGTSLASNVADIVNELLSIHYVIPVDMPLTENVHQIIEVLCEKIIKEPPKNDILLFVDMGSLTSLEETLQSRTHRNIIVIPTINTLLVLDAARKAVFLQYPLVSILNDVIRMNQKLNHTMEFHIRSHINQKSEKIIYTICYSGDGTAHYLESYLKDILENNGIYNIEVLALSNDSLVKIRSMIDETSQNKEVLCMIGNVDPGLSEYPFISVEDILMSNGIERLFSYIGDLEIFKNKEAIKSFERNVFIDVAFESIDKYLMYLSSKKLHSVILSFLQEVEQEMGASLKNQTLMRLIIHLSCMVERLLLREYEFHEDYSKDLEKEPLKGLYHIVNEKKHILEDACHIRLDEGECYYIVQILSGDTQAKGSVSSAL